MGEDARIDQAADIEEGIGLGVELDSFWDEQGRRR